MSTPPRLREESSARMAAVGEAADAAVDTGVPPAEALAKAAFEHGLPVGHVPVVVHAFNTGRAVRQLSETGPWAKASSHPTATVDQVLTHLSSLTSPPPSTKVAFDYAVPPGGLGARPAEPTAIASSFTKAASAPVPEPPAPRRPNDYLVRAHTAAVAFDALRDATRGMTGPEYAAVKIAAEMAHPGTGAEAFAFLESYDDLVGHKAAGAATVRPDPNVTFAHPALVHVRALAAAREGYIEPTENRPLGYQKMAADLTGTWFTLRSAVPTVDLTPLAPDTGLSVVVPGAVTTVPIKLAAEEESEGPAPKTLGDKLQAKVKGFDSYYAPKPGPDGSTTRAGTSVGRGFNYGFWGPMAGAVSNPFTGPALDVSDPFAADADKETKKLNTNLDRLEHQTAVQDVIGDPRLRASDPKTVIETYQTLSQLAPNVMRNQSVAADLIHRRIQTGPLSAFDLKQLLDMEKAYVSSRSASQRPQEEGDV